MSKHIIIDKSGNRLEFYPNLHNQLFLTMGTWSEIGHKVAMTLDKHEVKELIKLLKEMELKM